MASRLQRIDRRAAGAATAVLIMLSACSGGDPAVSPATTDSAASAATTTAAKSSGLSTSSTVAPTPTVSRPPGPAADLSTELSGGSGVLMGEATKPDLPRLGYVEREYEAVGTAVAYKVDGALTGDGRWTFVPDSGAPYRTRVLVRAPATTSAFSGTVIVEWLNVSGGLDANPEWTNTAEEIARSGDVWVGVSAQRIGVEGGPVLTKVPDTSPGAALQGTGLKATDPVRYATLQHPGDGYSSDMFTQVARAIRGGAGLRGLIPQRVIAAGESQSAFALVTYYNGVQPLTKAFDGFFVHSRGAVGLPLAAAGAHVNLANALSGTPTIFRTDLDVPVLDVQTETDVVGILNSYAARQPDNDRFRLWEVAGTAHADARVLGQTANFIDCGLPINNGPLHVVAKAGLRALKEWVHKNTPPPGAPRLEVQAGSPPSIVRDADGIATGGIRTPPVDVPVDALSGAVGPKPAPLCTLSGSTKPLAAERLTQLYPSRATYLERYRASADAAIKAGFVLAADRDAVLAYADPSRIAG